MKTLFKIAGIATWVIGIQLINTGTTLATSELRVNTGAFYSLSSNSSHNVSADLRQVKGKPSTISTNYTPPNNGGPQRTGDTGTR